MAVKLDGEQRQVLGTLLDVARRRKVTPTEWHAAISTGLVESTLRNLAGGDGTSEGWRQETASSYPGANRRDVRAAANRFFDETRKVLRQNPKISPYELAADVQRPLAKYRGRYAQQSDAVRAIINQYGGIKTRGTQDLLSGRGLGAGSVPTSGGLSGATKRTVSGSATVTVTPPEPGGSGQAADLAAALGQRPQVQLGPLPDYQFSALRNLRMPSGAAQLPSLGGPAPKTDDLAAQLASISDLQGQPLPVTVKGTGTANVPSTPKSITGGAGGTVKGVPGNPRKLQGGPVNEIIRIGEWFQRLGQSVREQPHFDHVDPVHVPGSYHYKGRAIDIPTSGNRGRQLVEWLIKAYPQASWIWNGPQPRNGSHGKINYPHGHQDHVHVQI